MSPHAHVTQALRDAHDHASRQAQDAAGRVSRTRMKLAEEEQEVAGWNEQRDALRAELDTRVMTAAEAEQTAEPSGPRIVNTGPDLMTSGQRPMRTSPMGPR